MADLITLVLFIAAICVYLLPTIVAYQTRHHNASAIFVVNFLLGWTLIGWVVALVWALVRPAPKPREE